MSRNASAQEQVPSMIRSSKIKIRGRFRAGRDARERFCAGSGIALPVTTRSRIACPAVQGRHAHSDRKRIIHDLLQGSRQKKTPCCRLRTAKKNPSGCMAGRKHPSGACPDAWQAGRILQAHVRMHGRLGGRERGHESCIGMAEKTGSPSRHGGGHRKNSQGVSGATVFSQAYFSERSRNRSSMERNRETSVGSKCVPAPVRMTSTASVWGQAFL